MTVWSHDTERLIWNPTVMEFRNDFFISNVKGTLGFKPIMLKCRNGSLIFNVNHLLTQMRKVHAPGPGAAPWRPAT